MGDGLSLSAILSVCAHHGVRFYLEGGQVKRTGDVSGMGADMRNLLKTRLLNGSLAQFLRENRDWVPSAVPASVRKGEPPASPAVATAAREPVPNVGTSAQVPTSTAQEKSPPVSGGLFPGGSEKWQEVGPAKAGFEEAPRPTLPANDLSQEVLAGRGVPVAPVPVVPTGPIAPPRPPQERRAILVQRLNPDRAEDFKLIGHCWKCSMDYFELPHSGLEGYGCLLCRGSLLAAGSKPPAAVAPPAAAPQEVKA